MNQNQPGTRNAELGTSPFLTRSSEPGTGNQAFVHLNVHSHYSRGWGLPTLEELCQAARANGMAHLALTDTNGLYGAVFFIQAAREAGLKPILGCELVHEKNRAVLLVKNEEGYANLCRLVSDLHCDQGFELIPALRKSREGLIVLSDDERLLKGLRQKGIEDLFVEISPGYGMARAYGFSRTSGIPPVATNRVSLLRKEDFPIHRVLRAVSLNTKLSRLTPEDLCRESSFFTSSSEMIALFPHAPAAIQNTLRVAKGCCTEWNLDRVVFPCFEEMSDNQAFEALYRAALDGCKRRYGEITPEVTKRLDHEMAIIRVKNYAHYFLVVADITAQARQSCGRGSAAASIVSYALGITHVDPIAHNLFFERFLNPERMDPPDIDVDFAWDERDQVIDYVFSKYGARRAAMVANHNTFAARSAVREVAKVLGLTDAEIGRVTKNIGFLWNLEKIRETLPDHPRMRGNEFTKPWDEILDCAVRLESRFNHLSTHCGGLVVVPDEIRRYCPVEVSASGLQVLQWEKDSVEDGGLVKIDILGNRSLAVIRDALDLVEKNTGCRIEYSSLNPIQDPETIRVFYDGNTFGVFYFESPATRQLLTKVASEFSLEEYRRMDHFHLNVVVTSIIRPASNRTIHTWVSRLHGEPWAPPHPLLLPVLRETLGLMVFQEQLSLAAIQMAGFSPGQADTLRKIVSKKHKLKKLRDFCLQFTQGAKERGVSVAVIDQVWEMIMGFEGYSFCKPHSASYTMVAYKSAFLRAHYPAEFMASVVSNGGGYYSTFGYLSEARRMGLAVLPPDINRSEMKYTGKGCEIRMGLMQLREITREAKEALLHERTKNGPFGSFGEFLRRVGGRMHLQDVRVLVKAGCFDSVSGQAARPRLMWETLRFYDLPDRNGSMNLFESTKSPLGPPFSKGGKEKRGFSKGETEKMNFSKGRKEVVPPRREVIPPPLTKGGRGGFVMAAEPAAPYGENTRMAPYPKPLMLRHEMETLGLPLSFHPLDRYRRVLEGVSSVPARDLPKWVGKQVTVIGWQVTRKTVYTKDGDPMQFISFEDRTGLYEAVLFPAVYDRYCHLLHPDRGYILQGKVEETFGAVSLTIHRVGFLDRY
jgi:error-prone DNA polymerase